MLKFSAQFFRTVFMWIVLTLATVFAAANTAVAFTGDIISITASPTTYSGAGQNITFTYVLDGSGNSATGAQLTQSNLFTIPALSRFSLSCPTLPAVGGNITCTAVYVTKATDTGNLQEMASGGILRPQFIGGNVNGALTSSNIVSYAPVPPTTFQLTINKSGAGAGSVTSSPPGINCGATCSASYSSGTSVTLTATPATGSTFSGWSGSGCSGTGTCVVSVTAASSVTASFTLQTFALTVNKSGTGTGSVTSSPPGINCGATCSASYSSGTSVTLTATPATGSTFSGWSGSGCSGTGTCVVSVTAASSVTADFAFTQVTQTITFTPPATQLMTTGNVTLGATASSGLTVTYLSNSTAVCTVSGNTAIFVSAGLCSLTAKQAGNAMYLAATDVNGSFTINKAANTITFNALTNRVFGSGSFAVSATATAGTTSFASTTGSICSVTGGNTVNLLTAGTCTIQASNPGNANFAAASNVSQSFNITQAANTITFNALTNRVFGSGSFAVSATATAGTTSFASTTGSICSVSGNTVSLDAAGLCTIQASNPGNANFAAASNVSQSFNITQAVNTITFNALTDKVFGSGPFTVSASAPGGATTFASSTTAICSVTGGDTVNLLSSGACTITASNTGDTNYAAASDVSRSFNITQADNSITFAAPADRAIGSGGFNLSATATSGLTVAFASTSASICTVSGTSVTLAAVGQCDITASQAGDANYVAATGVNRSFQITKATASIALVAAPLPIIQGLPLTLTATVTGVNPTGTVTFLDGTTVLGTAPIINGVAALVIVPSAAGSLNLQVSYSGDANNAVLPPSSTAPVVVTVAAKQVASTDLETKGGVTSQVESLRRFNTGQTNNVTDRLSSLHNRNRSVFSSNVQVNGIAVLGNIDPTADLDPTSAPIRAWVSGAVTFGQSEGSDEQKFTTSALTFGLDSEVSQSLVAGIALGYGNDDTKFGTNGTRNKGQNLSATLYADYAVTPSTFIDVLAGYGRGSIDTARFSTAGNILLTGNRDADLFYGSAGLTHDSVMGGLTLSPYGKITVQRIVAHAYTEDGASPWRLSYDELDATSVNGILGLNTAFQIPVDWGSLTAKAHAEYSASLVGDYSQSLGYADGIGTSSLITDKGLANSQFNVGAGFDFRVDSMSGGFAYDYSIAADKTSAHTLKATLGFQF
jgi:hypothetical protein